MAPSGEAYNVDWVVSNNSNVHVANNRDWFTSFTPFETYCGENLPSGGIKITGIGTVQLNVQLHEQEMGSQTNSRIITLHDVLYAPNAICNIFGQPPSDDYGFQLNFSQKRGMLIDKDGESADLIEVVRLPRLRLHGQCSGQSSLKADGAYMISAHWPDTERAQWDTQQAGQPSNPVISSGSDEPYSTDEKAWLKENFGNEYKFLQNHGLSIYDEEDRIDGRAIARGLMAGDGGEPKGNSSRIPSLSMGGIDLVSGDEDDSEDDNEDNTNSFLQELEDDPMSHLADYNFSSPELSWINEHYQSSSNFMLSFGLKPYEMEDCDEAGTIVRAIMEAD